MHSRRASSEEREFSPKSTLLVSRVSVSSTFSRADSISRPTGIHRRALRVRPLGAHRDLLNAIRLKGATATNRAQLDPRRSRVFCSRSLGWLGLLGNSSRTKLGQFKIAEIEAATYCLRIRSRRATKPAIEAGSWVASRIFLTSSVLSLTFTTRRFLARTDTATDTGAPNRTAGVP
jgi:hypothetical protein